MMKVPRIPSQRRGRAAADAAPHHRPQEVEQRSIEGQFTHLLLGLEGLLLMFYMEQFSHLVTKLTV